MPDEQIHSDWRPGAASLTVVMISLKKGYNMEAVYLNHRRMGTGSLC